jgi:hypothetical protein
MASVVLYWLPLGAGTGGLCVRGSGRVYEARAAGRLRRRRFDLYHSALVVELEARAYAIEMAPVWALRNAERGVVSEGSTGAFNDKLQADGSWVYAGGRRRSGRVADDDRRPLPRDQGSHHLRAGSTTHPCSTPRRPSSRSSVRSTAG